jgi:hypothetical protein
LVPTAPSLRSLLDECDDDGDDDEEEGKEEPDVVGNEFWRVDDELEGEVFEVEEEFDEEEEEGATR